MTDQRRRPEASLAGQAGDGDARAGRRAARETRRRRTRTAWTAAVGLVVLGVLASRGGDTGPGLPSERLDAREPAAGEWVDPASSGRPWSTEVEGILTFRGNPTRSFYGQGPVPRQPKILWTQPPGSGTWCSESTVDIGEEEGDFVWCGSGWTGQPAVWERDDRTWVALGAFDRNVHFLDGRTGESILPPFETGDIIKGSVTVDPDGFPLLYTGSRDNFYRVIALDRDEPTELWKLAADAVEPTLWNDDWDGSGLVLDDYLFEGGENSQWFAVKLNRTYDADGLVQVAPEVVFHAPGWDDELLDDLTASDPERREDVSIENSVAVSGNTIYFANSGGLVQGWDIGDLREGRDPVRIFRFWTGDDTDASLVVDEEGFLYVGSQYERGTDRADDLGQVFKLDPRRPDDPVVWSRRVAEGFGDGVWGTPALYQDIVIVPTDNGLVHAFDRADGTTRWTVGSLAPPVWQSPVVVDGVWIQGDCEGVLHAFDVRDTTARPRELWRLQLDGCIESTPAVWEGRIYVGSRGGRFYAIGDA